MKRFTFSTVVLFALLVCVSWEESALVRGTGAQTQQKSTSQDDESASHDEPSAATLEAVEKVLERLEKEPLDMTDIIRGAKKCCVRRKFETHVYGFTQKILRQGGLDVDAAEVTDQVLLQLKRKHWSYSGNPKDPEETVFNALKERVADTTYFAE